MKINGVHPPQATKTYMKNARKGEPKKTSPENDVADISREARAMQKAKAKLAEVPDLRQDQIEAIKDRLARNEYKVNVDRLADNLAKEIEAAIKNKRSTR